MKSLFLIFAFVLAGCLVETPYQYDNYIEPFSFSVGMGRDKAFDVPVCLVDEPSGNEVIRVLSQNTNVVFLADGFSGKDIVPLERCMRVRLISNMSGHVNIEFWLFRREGRLFFDTGSHTNLAVDVSDDDYIPPLKRPDPPEWNFDPFPDNTNPNHIPENNYHPRDPPN